MEHNDKVLLMGVTFGIAVVFTFAALVALAAGDGDECITKAEKIHEMCQAEFGKVGICEDAYTRTLLTCQINNNN